MSEKRIFYRFVVESGMQLELVPNRNWQPAESAEADKSRMSLSLRVSTVQVQRQGTGQRHGCRTSAGITTRSLSTSTVPNRG